MVGATLTYEVSKAALDRLVAFVALLVLLPILAIISLMVILDSPGGPLFAQSRVGKGGRRFTLYKFRTMQADNDPSEYLTYIERFVREGAPYGADLNGEMYKLVNDHRVTRVGAWLRRVDLDELPQLINVLKGDMSLVGPRPDIPEAVELYQDWHKERLAVQPGLTGAWQINGRYRVSFDQMASTDLDYIRHRSLLLDLKILALTIPRVLGKALERRDL